MRYQIRIAFFVLLCSMFVRGNDTFVTLGAGGLAPIKTSQIVMESEDLQISTHHITIRYVFRNTTDKDIEATVAFPLPDLDGSTVENEPLALPSETQLNFVRFSVREEGKAVAPKVELRAYKNNKDITEHLREAGLSPNVLLWPLNTALVKLPKATRTRLEKEELIIPREFYTRRRIPVKRGWWAWWTMRAQYYWTQRFPANSTVELIQTYRPVVGGSYIPIGSDGKFSAEPYCGTAATLKQVAALMKAHPVKGEDNSIALLERRIDYILTTANNWQGPIRRFYLSVSTDSPDDILVTCTPGLKRLAPTRYELTQHDFRPSSELKLLILQSPNQTAH